MSLQASAATQEEDWYDYRVDWSDKVSSVEELIQNNMEGKHYGPGSHDHSDYDNAWDDYCSLKKDPYYVGVTLTRINPEDGSETLWNS